MTRAVSYSVALGGAEGPDVSVDPSQVESWLQGFPDRAFIADAHRPAVANAYRLQIVSGAADGRYHPLAQLTRAQGVGMLYAAFFKMLSPLTDTAVPHGGGFVRRRGSRQHGTRASSYSSSGSPISPTVRDRWMVCSTTARGWP